MRPTGEQGAFPGRRDRGRRRVTALALVAGLALLWAPGVEAFRNIKDGESIPVFSLQDINGATRASADFAGQPKAILFFSDNDRSKKVLPELEALYEKYKGDKLQVIGIYVGSQEEDCRAMAAEAKTTFPVLLDLSKKAYGDFGIFVTPVIGFVDQDEKLGKEQPYVPLLSGVIDIEAKVILGKMKREDADLALRPEEAPKVSTEEKEAEKIYNLGLILMERGMKDKAVEKFKEVLKIDPSYCKVRLQLGNLYVQDGKVDEAKAEFEYVLKCDPRSHEAKVGMGTVYELKGDYDKAIEMLQSSFTLNPRPELAHYELGKVYEKKGDLAKAVENYKLAIDRLLAK